MKALERMETNGDRGQRRKGRKPRKQRKNTAYTYVYHMYIYIIFVYNKRYHQTVNVAIIRCLRTLECVYSVVFCARLRAWQQYGITRFARLIKRTPVRPVVR